MNKLNAMAAILKFINGCNDSKVHMQGVYDYITDPAKTNNGTLVSTHGCSKEHPIEDMLANKKLWQKTHGKQWEHFVLALAPNGTDASPKDVLNAVNNVVATVYPEYMSVIAVHTDSKFIHGHVLLDVVNAVTGLKFSQSPADLNRVRQKTNNVLDEHGFGIITSSTNDIVDHTDYSNEESYAFLELDESQRINETEIASNSAFNNTSMLNVSDIYEGMRYFKYNYGGCTMNNYTNSVSKTQAMPVATSQVEVIPSTVPVNALATPAQGPTVPVSTIETVPSAIVAAGNSYPNTSLITGPVFRIKGPLKNNFGELTKLVERTTANAQAQQYKAVNVAITMRQRCQQAGCPSNVIICSSPIFEVDTNYDFYPSNPWYDVNKY